MFIDEVDIYIKGGDGGDGCVSFRREKYVPRGGPNGGNGGKGGAIIIRTNDKIDTLLDLKSKKRYIAEDGGNGKGSNKNGKDGDDLIINVPKGTLVKDIELGLTIKDLKKSGESVSIARGGNLGRGNTFFKSPTNQTPDIAEKGRKGQERQIKLELKLIADIGIIGLPNAGKSTLLSQISAAHPKVGSYPFTTLHPNLGIVELEDYRRLVFADIPGIIEDAHNGHGLGNKFLKHIERTRILVHLIDISSKNDPLESYHLIKKELSLFNAKLDDKPEIIVINKIDLLDTETYLSIAEDLNNKLSRPVYPISSATGKNVKDLVDEVANLVDRENADALDS